MITGGGGGATISVRFLVSRPRELAAASVRMNVPAAVGVPEICPVARSTANPGGKPKALNALGDSQAEIRNEKGRPSTTSCVSSPVMTGGGT